MLHPLKSIGVTFFWANECAEGKTPGERTLRKVPRGIEFARKVIPRAHLNTDAMGIITYNRIRGLVLPKLSVILDIFVDEKTTAFLKNVVYESVHNASPDLFQNKINI